MDLESLGFDVRFNTRQAAEYLGYDPQTLRNWRCEGKRPKWHKVNGHIRYWKRDLEAWIEECDKETAKRLKSRCNLKGQRRRTDDDAEGDE